MTSIPGTSYPEVDIGNPHSVGDKVTDHRDQDDWFPAIPGLRKYGQVYSRIWTANSLHLSDQGPTNRASTMLGKAASMLSFMFREVTWYLNQEKQEE